jgi:hypothetical protein
MTKRKEDDDIDEQEIDELDDEIEEIEEDGKEAKTEPEVEADVEPQEEGQEQLTEEERAEIRERRKRARKARKERDRRERFELQNSVATLKAELQAERERVKRVETTVSTSEARAIDNELSELARVYNDAQKVLAEAVTEQDGAKYAQAMQIKDRAFAKYHELEQQKQHRFAPPPKSAPSEPKSEELDADPVVARKAEAWQKRVKADWYDPNLGNTDSKIAAVVAEDVLQDGYSPRSEEYWEELTDRLKERLPHRFRTNRQAPPQIVGGGGRDSSSAATTEQRLPPGFVENLKKAGMWDDLPKRKAAILEFNANRKGAR